MRASTHMRKLLSISDTAKQLGRKRFEELLSRFSGKTAETTGLGAGIG